MKTVSIIRDRGQLTIPDSIRKIVSWIQPMSAVSVSLEKPDEIIIKPHQTSVNWNQIWENIHHSRSISGKGKLSAGEFLETDRASR